MQTIARLPYLYDLPVYPYATFTKSFVYSTGTSDVDKVPVNLTGCTAQLMVRRSPSDPTPLVAISEVASIYGAIVLGGVLGTIDITLTPLATGRLFGVLGYQLFLTMVDHQVKPLLSGHVDVQPGFVH